MIAIERQNPQVASLTLGAFRVGINEQTPVTGRDVPRPISELRPGTPASLEMGAVRWRKHVATEPQCHENHILAATLSFNLLMGRQWPPSAKDVTEAEAICRQPGLGDLLARMPAGMEQVVGKTGWRLSQGERSRVFLARALLLGGDLITLDESFAALDPENLRQCLECVLRRAQTVMVVAHP